MFVSGTGGGHASGLLDHADLYGYGKIDYLPDAAYPPSGGPDLSDRLLDHSAIEIAGSCDVALDHVARTVNLYAAAGVLLDHLKFVAVVSVSSPRRC